MSSFPWLTVTGAIPLAGAPGIAAMPGTATRPSGRVMVAPVAVVVVVGAGLGVAGCYA